MTSLRSDQNTALAVLIFVGIICGIGLVEDGAYKRATQECEERLAVPSGAYNVTPGTGVAIISMCEDMPPLMVEKVNILSDCRDCHYRVHEEG
jgi:hypothetical protein